MASNVEIVSISWRHHGKPVYLHRYLWCCRKLESVLSSYTTASTNLKGGMLVSPYPSVRLSCCGQNRGRSVSSTIHFIFAHLIKQLQKMCCMRCLFQNSKITNFGEFFNFFNFDFVFFSLGIQFDSIVWVIMRPQVCVWGVGGGVGWGVSSLRTQAF